MTPSILYHQLQEKSTPHPLDFAPKIWYNKVPILLLYTQVAYFTTKSAKCQELYKTTLISVCLVLYLQNAFCRVETTTYVFCLQLLKIY